MKGAMSVNWDKWEKPELLKEGKVILHKHIDIEYLVSATRLHMWGVIDWMGEQMCQFEDSINHCVI